MIDLHMHTRHSDGIDTLYELLHKAKNKKLEIISITDHVQIAAYEELETHPNLRKIFNGIIIPGSELKTVYNGVPIEILAYGVDYKKLRIHKIDQKKLQVKTLQTLKNTIKNLGFKYNEKNLYIDRQNFEKQWASYVVAKEILKYKENIELIKKYGNFTPTNFYRMHVSNKNSIFYYDETIEYLPLEETINRIHEAGGLAFLAHPFIYPFDDKKSTIENILLKTKLDGIEVEYPLFSSKERETLKQLAKKYHKYISGGSDYHSKAKPDIEMGTGKNNNLNIPSTLVEDWIQKVQKM